MGRRPWTNRLLVEDCTVLDVSDITSAAAFKESFGRERPLSIGDAIRELYMGHVQTKPRGLDINVAYPFFDPATGVHEQLECKFRLTATPCHFGGFRFWFRCPIWVGNEPCQRRVGKLYRPPDARIFGCRQCYDLTYRSSRIHDKRVDALARDPARLQAWMDGDDPRKSLLAIQAHRKLYP